MNLLRVIVGFGWDHGGEGVWYLLELFGNLSYL